MTGMSTRHQGGREEKTKNEERRWQARRHKGAQEKRVLFHKSCGLKEAAEGAE